VHALTQRVTAVTPVTADTSVTSASDPARRRRPEVRKASRFQHRFGFELESSNQWVLHWKHRRGPRSGAGIFPHLLACIAGPDPSWPASLDRIRRPHAWRTAVSDISDPSLARVSPRYTHGSEIMTIPFTIMRYLYRDPNLVNIPSRIFGVCDALLHRFCIPIRLFIRSGST
jgi:hypothetical protein